MNGITKEYHKDGTYFEWHYENGKKNGISTRYFKTGKKAIIWEYKNDEIIKGIGFYPTGEKNTDIRYKNGMQQGITTEYYKSGEKIFEWRYKNGQLKGESIEYSKNGNVKNVLNF